ncbi:MAG: M48 family metalloprotease [Planctomycetes bacterium]|nr:M48 family metalloprotease [Planctomycetota bacterium]MBL7039759.1 M48 family metalloprotease [Pirellulaceae bacterium]
MPISMHCTQCQAAFQVPDDWAGRRGKCKTCGAVIEVPGVAASAGETIAQEATGTVARPETSGQAGNQNPPSPAAPKVPSQQLHQEVQAAFAGEIAPVKVPITYRLGILLVSMVMVLLPLIYIALICLVGYAVYYHLVNHIEMLSAGRGRGKILVFLAYVAPLVIGGIAVLFMIKPLFARPAKRPRTRSLTRDGEPIVFAFVERICAVVRAPRPKRIDIDGQVNASASFRRGIWSMIAGNDLVLTIGMPLVSGLDMRQFGGVLAHEFGHFSQGVGMRLTYIIRTISHWFTRVVYERDTWDEWLANSTEGMDLRIAWVLYLAKLFVWMTRKVLWVLMMIGHSVAGYMLRQMEFDADRYEARLAGSDAFESTARKLHELMLANQKALEDLSRFHREGRLGDDLPRLTRINVDDMPDDVKQQLRQSADESTTGLMDTHPSDRDRIASAHRENSPGIFRLERPASELFVYWDESCKGVTWDFYREIFGQQFQPSDMHPLDDLLERQNRQKKANEAMERYFFGGFNMLRSLRLPTVYLSEPGNPKELGAALQRARKRLVEARPSYDEAFATFDKADTNAYQAAGAYALHRGGLRPPEDQFEIPVSDRAGVKRVSDAAGTEMGRMGTRLEPFEEALGERLVAALQLLYVPQVASRIEEAEAWRNEAQQLLPVLQTLSRLLAKATEVRNCKIALALLFHNLDGNENNESLTGVIIERAKALRESLAHVHEVVGDTPYPFDHAQGQISISDYMIPNIPAEQDVGALYETADHLLERLPDLYSRVAGRLAEFAERIEQVLGLAPLEGAAGTAEP